MLGDDYGIAGAEAQCTKSPIELRQPNPLEIIDQHLKNIEEKKSKLLEMKNILLSHPELSSLLRLSRELRIF